jgi:ADP-ribosylation factor GTPase-activating protein 2/3
MASRRFPGEVILTDVVIGDESTPAGDEDDFFSSWDKPTIKKPTPPISRTSTPPVVGRTASPLAGPNNGAAKDIIARSASPLSKPDGENKPPPASRITSSAALRKTGAAGGPRKANVLGAKKVPKLGAKKVTADLIDFDEAEKKAKEEAERIEKLGYDPDAEDVVSAKKGSAADGASVISPTPVSPKGGYGSSSHTRQKSNAEVERLGMGVARLGFGQVGGAKPAPKKAATGGFGSVGPIKSAAEGTFPFTPSNLPFHANPPPPDDDEKYARTKFGAQKGISSDEFFGKGAFDPNAQAEAKGRLQGFEGATAISSNAYFGRPEEEAPEEYGDLETAAKDFVRRFGITAGDDLENLSSMAGEVSGKLQNAIRSYLGN